MTELAIIFLLTVINGVLAMSEAAVIAARKPRLQQQIDKGSAGARIAMALKDEPSRFLSTVQIGITLVGMLLGAFGGATVASDIARSLRQNETLAPYADALGLLIIVVATTYIQLIIGELVPKRLALHRPETIASQMARPLRLISVITAPVVKLLSISTDAVLWLLGTKESGEAPITEEEITAMLTVGVEAGVFEEAEQEMVESVFKLGARRVTSIMTPRTEIVWLNLEDDPEENQRKLVESHYSRFPVCDGDLDHVIGLVRAKDLLPRVLAGEPLDLRAAMVPPIFVPESMTVARSLEIFRESGKHIVFVINEYGGLQGLVTTQDILEEIVGDIEQPQAVMREDGSYLIDGLMAIDDFKELVDIEHMPGEGDHFETIAGFVMMQQGRIPQTGDHFTWENLRFEVVDMDGNRIDKLLVSRAAPAVDADAAGTDSD